MSLNYLKMVRLRHETFATFPPKIFLPQNFSRSVLYLSNYAYVNVETSSAIHFSFHAQ